LIDVGARGDFHDVFAPIQSQTEVIAFEPDREEAARMSASLAQSLWQKATVLPHAVGHTQSNRDFHLFQMREFSSLLLPNPSVLRGKTGVVERTIQLDTIGLDDLYLQGTLPQTIDFIKVDTQGSELEILQSSEARILPHLLGIETEVEFVEAYQNQPLFHDINIYLHQAGFELVILTTKYRMTGTTPHTRRLLFAGDAVFLRGSRFLGSCSEQERGTVLPKLLAIYALYGLWSAALDLATQFAPAIAVQIQADYDSLKTTSLRWRGALLRDFILAWLSGDRTRRVRLARRAMRVIPANGFDWDIATINE